MKQAIIVGATAAVAAVAGAQTIRFDDQPLGATPAGWTCGVTGSGTPRWTVEPSPSQPGTRALVQGGKGTFPWCVRTGTSIADGFVEAHFQPISGREDQAAGVVWRWKDGDNYYVARANALENNVSLYYTERGTRKTLKYVDAPVARATPHTLRVEFAGKRIAVWLDGTRYIEWRDEHITGPGAVGVWTKADSVTAFSEFSYGSGSR
jgi:FtsP/CotA-like multicopper oxidase with cupredoxin domain